MKLGVKVKPDADEKKAPVGRPASKPAAAAAKPAAKVRTWRLLFPSHSTSDLLQSSPLTVSQKTAAAAKKTAAAAPKKAAAAAPKAKAAAPKKAATATKNAPAAKAAAPVKKAATKGRPNKAAPAPAVEDKPVILGKTKGGRVTKTTSKSAPPAAKKVTKVPAKSKATPKKATPKKATPKKA